MAVTTKTLTPTNQVVILPDMTEKPNASVLADGIGKDADAINALDIKTKNVVSLGHICGEGTTHEERLADIISRITTNNEYTQFSCTYFYNGNWLYEGYVYPNKDYGGGTIIPIDNHVIVWGLNAGVLSVYDETSNLLQYTKADGTSTQYYGVSANTVTKSGRYYMNGNCTDIPFLPNGCYLDVNCVSAGYIKQIAYDDNSNRIAVRTKTNGTWSSWEELSKLTTTKYDISSSFSDITDLEYVQCLLFRSGNVVTFKISGHIKATITASTESIVKPGLIPERYRPTTCDQQGVMSFRYRHSLEVVGITTSGELSLDGLLRQENADGWMGCTLTYVVE